LKKGLKIALVSGLLANVESIYAIDTTATVYNFEVEKTHTYYVGTEGVLVHNSCIKGIVKNNILSLASEVPSNSNVISRTKFYNKGEHIFQTGDAGFDHAVFAVRNGGDKKGIITEELSHYIFEKKLSMTNLSEQAKLSSNTGFDGIYIEGTIQNPTRIIITEAKPWTVGKGVELAPEAGLLPAQMSDRWIENVRIRLLAAGGNKAEIAQMIGANPNLIEKFVVTVNKEIPLNEVLILKLGSY
jgi:hypothetical protein